MLWFYFSTIAVLGLWHAVARPEIALAMFNPWHFVQFFLHEPTRAFIALGSVVLAVTGA